MAVTNARQSLYPESVKPVPKTWSHSFPARAVLRAVTATLATYGRAFLFSLIHDEHDQKFTVCPGRTRVICDCGVEQWL